MSIKYKDTIFVTGGC